MPNTEKKLVDLDLLTYYDGKIKNWTEGAYKIVEQDTAETGYLKTYVLQVNGADAADSVKINIPKDFMLKAAEIKTCTVADEPVSGLVVGDKYFDFTINVADASATASHVYLAVKDVFQAYVQGDGITITGQTIAANTGDGLQINASTKAIEVKTGDGIEIDATTKAVEAKIGTGLEFNSSSRAIDLVAQSSDAGAPAIGGVTTADYAAFKGALDTITEPTETAPTAAATKNETIVTKTHTFTTADVDATAGSFTVTEYYATYDDATPTTTGASPAAAKSGLMSGTDKDNLDALVDALGTDVSFASNTDVDDLFD